MSERLKQPVKPTFSVWQPASLDTPSPVIDDQAEAAERDALSAEQQAIEAAKTQAQSEGFQQGYETGLQQGLEEGRIQGQQEGQKLAYEEHKLQFLEQKRQIQALIAQFETELNYIREHIAENVLHLSLDVGKSLTKTALQLKPELILPLIQDILHELAQTELPAYLILNPSDADLVRSRLSDKLSDHGWSIMEDPAIEAGSCKLSSASNELDASLSSRWQKLLQALNQNPDWLI